MLQSDPNAENAPPAPPRKRSPVTYALLTLAVIVVAVMRADWWNWSTARPLLFGIIPVGLWWQVVVSLAACGVMWLLVKFAWPDHLEWETRDVESSPDKRQP